MIGRFFTATLFAAASLAAPAAMAQDYPPQPAVGTPKPFSVPASETYQLPNGMRVTLIPYGIIPKAVVSLRVEAGGLNEGENVWLSNLVAQMMREGAGGKSGSEIAEAAASMGGNLNVGTGRHETSLSLNVLSEHADDAVRLIGDVAMRPTFPASELDRLRQGLLRTAAVAKSQPQPLAEAALASAYYGTSHPYGRLYPTDAQLKAYTLGDVQRFYAQNFGARRARLYVAGKFDTAAVKAAIEQAYSGWAPGAPRLALPPQPQAGPKLLLVDRPGAPQSTIRIAFAAPPAGAPDDLDFRVSNALLGGSFNSRITKNIREQKGYTYSPFSSVTYNAGEALWAFNADVTTDVTGPALKEVLGEIKRLQSEAPPADEAAGTRAYLAGIFVLQNASPSGLVSSLANRDIHGLPADWLETYVPNILAVDASQMQSIARQRLPLDRATIVVVGDMAKVEPQLRSMPELRGVPSQKVTPF